MVELAADRAPEICQSQSVNIFLPGDVDKWDLHMLHWQAWERGVKSLYYLRSKSVQRAAFAGGDGMASESGRQGRRRAHRLRRVPGLPIVPVEFELGRCFRSTVMAGLVPATHEHDCLNRVHGVAGTSRFGAPVGNDVSLVPTNMTAR